MAAWAGPGWIVQPPDYLHSPSIALYGRKDKEATQMSHAPFLVDGMKKMIYDQRYNMTCIKNTVYHSKKALPFS